MSHKLTIIVPDPTKEIMDSVRKDWDLSFTDQTKRGVKLLQYILDAQKRGAEFVVTEKGKQPRVVEIIFD
jgi:hypothetical protein